MKFRPNAFVPAEDRMLLLFWIPILLREFALSPMTLSPGAYFFTPVALLWAFVHGVRIAIHSVRTAGPLRALLWL